MGKMSDFAIAEEQKKFEIAEAEFFALPNAQVQTLDGIKGLMTSHKDLLSQYQSQSEELLKLKEAFAKQTSNKAKWTERAIGFISGIAASFLTAMVL
jgi:hypothetical protein